MGFLSLQSIIPPGTIFPYAGSTAPSGWALCNGGSYTTATQAALFSVIGYTYGGSGANFNVPNTQGVFLRGAGSQVINNASTGNVAITYTSESLGTPQGDQMQGHLHGYIIQSLEDTGGGDARGSDDYPLRNANTTTPINDGTNGNPRTGNETRPANIVVNYIIKL